MNAVQLQGVDGPDRPEEEALQSQGRKVKIECLQGDVCIPESTCRHSRKLNELIQTATPDANGDIAIVLDEPCDLVREVLRFVEVFHNDTAEWDAELEQCRQRRSCHDVFKLLGVAANIKVPVAEHLCNYVLETVEAKLPSRDELRAALGIRETTSAVQVEQDGDVEVVTVTNAQAMIDRTEEQIQASKSALKCEICSKKFTATFKRHHCRSCYRAACHSCSSNRVAFSHEDAKRRRDMMDIRVSSDFIHHMLSDLLRDYVLERVCNACHDFLNKTIGCTGVCQQTRAGLLHCNFTLPVLSELATLSKELRATVAGIVETVFEAGRQLPWYTPTEEEKRLLLANCELFNGHHRMVATVVKCVDWKAVQHRRSQQMQTTCAVAHADIEEETKNAGRVLELLTSKVERQLSCKEVGCLVCRGETECHPFGGYSTDPEAAQQQQLDCFDAYELLTNSQVSVHTRLRSLLVDILSTISQHLRPLLVHSLLQALKDDAWPLDSALWHLLLNWTDHKETRYEIFLNLLVLTKEESFADTATGLLMYFIRSVHDQCGEEAAKELEATQHLISALHKQDDPKAMLDMLNHIQGTARLPVNLDATVIDLLLKDAKRTTGCNGMTHLPLRVHVDGGTATAQRILQTQGLAHKAKEAAESRERSCSLPTNTATPRTRTASFPTSSSFSSSSRSVNQAPKSNAQSTSSTTEAGTEGEGDREQLQETNGAQPAHGDKAGNSGVATTTTTTTIDTTPSSSQEVTVGCSRDAGEEQGKEAATDGEGASEEFAKALAVKPQEWVPLPLDSSLNNDDSSSGGSESSGSESSGSEAVEKDATGVTCSIGLGVKQDDVRPDYVAVQTIQMAKLLLSRGTSGDESLTRHVFADGSQHEHLPFAHGHHEATRLVTYNVVPTKPGLGLVEWVDDAVSVASILRMPEGFSQFLMQFDGGQAKENVTYSLAAFSVLVYLLGVGDRHMENEMMTRDGQLFHIDFGYLLGKDPKERYLNIKFGILSRMLHSTNAPTNAFLDLAAEVYLRLRPFAHVLVPMLTSLFKLTPVVDPNTIGTEDEARKLFTDRFRLHQSDEAARASFMEELKNELESNQHAFLKAQRMLASTSRDVGSAAYSSSQTVVRAFVSMVGSVFSWGNSTDEETARADAAEPSHKSY